MEGKLVNNVSSNVNMFMKGASNRLKKMQDTPIGIEKRSPQEKAKMWKSIMSMPRDERNDIMSQMAQMAGHKGDGIDNCDWCKFVREQVGK